MALQIIRLPMLVVAEIMKSMTIYEAIPFSFASKRCAKLTEISLHKMQKIRMRIELGKVPYFTLCFEDAAEHFLKWFIGYKLPKNARKKTPWNALGMTMYPLQMETIEPVDVLHTMYKKRDNQQMNIVIMHFLSSFKTCRVVELLVDSGKSSRAGPILKSLTSVNEVETVIVRDASFRSDQLGGAIASHVLKNIKITKKFDDDTSSFLSIGKITNQLYCEDEVKCFNGTWMCPETLLRLNCTRISLLKSRLQISDLMAFLRKWQQSTGDDMKRITKWEIDFPSESNSLDFEELHGTPCDLIKRPQFDGLNAIDITRISDGLEATIQMFTDTRLQFNVWHQ